MNYLELWNDISDKSNAFEKTCLIKNKFKDFPILDESIKETIHNLSNDDYSMAMKTARVFNGYSWRSDQSQKVVKSEFLENENVNDWMKRELSSDDPFIILANVERLSEELSVIVSDLIHPFVNNFSFPFMTGEIFLIMGRYGLTPFGIHKDHPAGDWHRVFQVNMGPGKKTMHFWDKKVIESLGNKSIFTNHLVSKDELERLKPLATSYTIEEGDAIFFSPSTYHIAESHKFSVSLSLILFNKDKKEFLEEAIEEYLREMLNDSNDSNGNTSNFIEASAYLAAPTTLIKDLGATSSWINRALSDYKLKYQSSRALRASPIFKDFNYKDISEIRNFEFELNHPFQIFSKVSNDEMDLFIRGRKLMLVLIPEVLNIIEDLNVGKSISMKSVIELLSPSLDEQAIFLLIKKFYQMGGIRIVKE